MAIAPALMLMILAGSFLIFFLLPRISSRYLSAYTFDERCLHRLHRSRPTRPHRPDSAVECGRHAHRDQNDLQGAYDLKWRGIALSTLTARVWTNSYEQTRLRPAGDGIYRLAPPADADQAQRRLRADPFVIAS
jgi:hypothetical protein